VATRPTKRLAVYCGGGCVRPVLASVPLGTAAHAALLDSGPQAASALLGAAVHAASLESGPQAASALLLAAALATCALSR
jgi:hypothetical protein